MSTVLLGDPNEPWPLARAVDALAESARRAGVPGLVWLVGLFYPGLPFSVELATSLLSAMEELSGTDLPGAGAGIGPLVTFFAPSAVTVGDAGLSQALPLLLVLLPFFFLVYRLIVGLARLSDPRLWKRSTERGGLVEVHVGVLDPEHPERTARRTVRLRDVWAAGKGLAASGLGLWLLLLGLLLGATVAVLALPLGLIQILGLSPFKPVVAALLLPLLLVLGLYAVVLQVLNQLALHSLAHNRRGVASALQHAWRLARGAPWSAFRAALVDVVLFLTVLVVSAVLERALRAPALVGATSVCLFGFAGVTRAGYWARAYRDLGGLSSADVVPGLS